MYRILAIAVVVSLAPLFSMEADAQCRGCRGSLLGALISAPFRGVALRRDFRRNQRFVGLGVGNRRGLFPFLQQVRDVRLLGLSLNQLRQLQQQQFQLQQIQFAQQQQIQLAQLQRGQNNLFGVPQSFGFFNQNQLASQFQNQFGGFGGFGGFNSGFSPFNQFAFSGRRQSSCRF